MHYRQLGRTGWKVSDISFGAWAIGGAWGSVSDDESLAALHKAIDCGVNFIDTADVYGDGRSERLIAQLKKSEKREIVVATKAGRRLPRQTVEGYSRQNLTAWVEDSLRNLATDSLDLLQLHCPPTELYFQPEAFDILYRLVKAGGCATTASAWKKWTKRCKPSSTPTSRACKSSSIVSVSGPLTNFSCKPSARKW